MAITALSDVIVPSVFAGYILEEDNRVNRMVQSGAVVSDAQIAAFLAGGGTTFDLPSWKATDSDSENVSDDTNTAVTAQNLSARKQIVSRVERNAVWGSADLTAMLAGSDPLANAASRIAQFRSARREDTMLAVLEGLLNVTNGVLTATHANVIAEKATSAAPVPANIITSGDVIDTLASMADEQGTNVMVVHSDVHRKLQKLNLITFEATNTQDIGWGSYLGFTLVVNDGVAVGSVGETKIAGTVSGFWYKSYLLQPGSFSLTAGSPKNPVEVERQALQGSGGGAEYLIVRDSYSPHVYGTSWTGTPAGATPTNTEYAVGTNYAKVYEDKKIGVAVLEHNV